MNRIVHSLLIFSVVTGLFSGCIPLTQLQEDTSILNLHAIYNEEDKYVLFAAGQPDGQTRPKQYEILETNSYAVGPGKERHQLRIHPHIFDITAGHAFVRDDIYILSSNGTEAIKPEMGRWTFHLQMRQNGKIIEHDFSFQLWKFWYNPIIDGPPN